ncbi:MAG TPA: DUF86 domain-containing protein [Acidobacteriota bacterium]|nr:DUF86 domain-containing protein [Acidobacteriota bacterium]
MQLEAKKLLEDIRQGSESNTALRPETPILPGTRRVLRSAVERQFQIIGEALIRLTRTDPETAAAIGDYRRIVAFRNILVHAYGAIDHPARTFCWSVQR